MIRRGDVVGCRWWGRCECFLGKSLLGAEVKLSSVHEFKCEVAFESMEQPSLHHFGPWTNLQSPALWPAWCRGSICRHSDMSKCTQPKENFFRRNMDHFQTLFMIFRGPRGAWPANSLSGISRKFCMASAKGCGESWPFWSCHFGFCSNEMLKPPMSWIFANARPAVSSETSFKQRCTKSGRAQLDTWFGSCWIGWQPEKQGFKDFEHLTVPAHSSSSGCLKFGRCEYLKNLFVMPSADLGPRNSFLRYSSFMKLVFALSNVLQHQKDFETILWWL